MIVVVFRAHRTETGLGEAYMAALRRMEALATKMPGYVSHKAYVAQDGHPDHVATKRLGRERFYEDYHLLVCEVLRESRFSRESDGSRRSVAGGPVA